MTVGHFFLLNALDPPRELSVQEIEAIRYEVSRRGTYKHTYSVDFAREVIKFSRKTNP